MLERMRSRRDTSRPELPLDDSISQTPAPEAVLISSGLHAAEFPVSGRSVAEIRRRLADRLDIDPESQAVVDGHFVSDDTVVTAGQVLSFMRHAGEKGALPWSGY
jgi:hypothetical protein